VSALYQQSAREIVKQLLSGALNISDTLDDLRQRIEEVDDQVNALPTTCFERAYAEAHRLQELPASKRGPLAGLPVTIKDLNPVQGVRTTFGSKVYEHYVPAASDQLVERIESRGGVIYAKSNTPEFGAGGITFNDVYPTTASPHDLNCSSGGSSGGAAASLASGCAWLSHGSDMAGSLRTPAAFCGVASLRPSPGTISADSLYLPFDVLGANGPMARDVLDLALFTDVMKNENNSLWVQAANEPIKPQRVAVSPDLHVTNIEPMVRENFMLLLDKLSNEGWQIEERAPDLSDVHTAFDVLRAQAFAVGLEEIMNNNPGVLKQELEWNIRQGIELSSDQIRQALRAQGLIVSRAATFMQDYDLLLCPATSVVSAPVNERFVGFRDGVAIADYYRWLAIAYATTMTTLPVITLPWLLPTCDKPGGIQLVGNPSGERALFSIARELESMLEWNPVPVKHITKLP